MNGYIYSVTNIVNNKRYIGQTKNKLSKRKYEHFSSLRKGEHWNINLQHAFNKHGEDNFIFECLHEFESDLPIEEFRLLIDQLEVSYIEKYDSIDNGYNLTTGGKSCVVSEQTKRKMSESKMGEKNNFYGKKHDPESFKNRVPWNKGMKGFLPGVFDGEPNHKPEIKKKIVDSTRKSRSNLTPEQAIEICRRALAGERYADIAADFNTPIKVVSTIKQGVRWADVTEHLRNAN